MRRVSKHHSSTRVEARSREFVSSKNEQNRSRYGRDGFRALPPVRQHLDLRDRPLAARRGKDVVRAAPGRAARGHEPGVHRLQGGLVPVRAAPEPALAATLAERLEPGRLGQELDLRGR